LLVALRHLNPPLDGVAIAPGDDLIPGNAGKNENLPGIAKEPGRQAANILPVVGPALDLLGVALPTETKTPLTGIASGENTPSDSPSSKLYPPTPDKNDAKDQPGKNDAKEQPENNPPEKGDKAKPKDNKPGDAKREDGKNGDGKPADAKPAPKPAKPYFIPERLQMLTVVQDPDLHVLQDPGKRSHEPFLSTTDNSNTQFAILALWAAQRYGVPMERTLKLVVRRFVTSQNEDGSWYYHYRFGGGGEPWGPSMTCVGLIGLAVGHGMAGPNQPGGKAAPDPRIVNGLTFLSKHVEAPAERLNNLPMQNLYFLWSVERVAVLYNLPKIGDKDWYRWGAEVLIANQELQGNWKDGGYHGNSPALDTCLALLFLKRANLAKDLTEKLPFQPGELNKGVMDRLEPPPPSKPPEPIQKTPLPVEKPAPAPADDLISKPLGQLKDTTATPATSPVASTTESGSKTKWVILFAALFVLLAGGSAFFFWFGVHKRKDNDKDRKLKGPKARHKFKATAFARQE
jgi:hypothetical protein